MVDPANFRVPKEIIKEIDIFQKATNTKHRTQAFHMAFSMQGQVINEKTQRLPKSKDCIKIIDVRYKFKI